ncbi:MAG: hypothetical protein KAY32_14070 [Candidatus Eisenbacteria sp.]|nr:hypothetical protein [Candidatus Eisenbacteria bacterium]
MSTRSVWILYLYLAVAAVAGSLGCSGDDGKQPATTEEQKIVTLFQGLAAAYNSGDLTAAWGYFDDDFLHNGATEFDGDDPEFLEGIDESSYTVQLSAITPSVEGTVATCSFHGKFFEDGELDYEGDHPADYDMGVHILRKAGSEWKIYGNQIVTHMTLTVNGSESTWDFCYFHIDETSSEITGGPTKESDDVLRIRLALAEGGIAPGTYTYGDGVLYFSYPDYHTVRSATVTIDEAVLTGMYQVVRGTFSAVLERSGAPDVEISGGIFSAGY